MGYLAVVGCALLGQATLPLPQSAAWAQTVSSATVTEVLDSNQVFIQEQRAAVNSVAQRQQRVRTQAARTSLRFDNGAVARLAHNSSLVVGQCAQLNRGTLLVNGSLNGCSTTTIAGVRGTIYTMEVTEDGETIIQVFEGEVAVGQRTDAPSPEPPEEPDGEGIEDGLDDGMLEDGSPVPDPAPLGDGLQGDGLDPEVPYPNPGDVPSPEDAPTEAQESPGAAGKQTPAPSSKPRTNPSGSDPSGYPTDDAGSPFGVEGNLSPDAEASPSETVEFKPDTVLVINEGQQVTVNAENDEAVVSSLTAEDFINLLEGPLIQGFAIAIPGLGDLESTFRQLFPGIPLPFGLPSINIPLPAIRFPF